ncbi:acyl-CoA dehydrogenase family protein, partial [Rhizobiaceae sp. 2RAB30]
KAFARTVRSYLSENLPEALAHKVRYNQRLTREDYVGWQSVLAATNWYAIGWPREAGGPGLTPTQRYLFDREYGALPCPHPCQFGIAMAGPVIYTFGTDEQKNRFLPGIRENKDFWCQGYSEPGAGSDLAALRTTARRDGDAYVVNGQKIWTTLAHCANWIFALVRTSRDEKVRQKGITVLLIDMKTPGVKVRPIANLRGETDFCEVFFDNVRVPVENVVGEVDQGWNVAKSVLGHERIFLGAPTRPEIAIERLEKLARARGAFDDPAFLSRYAKHRLDLYDLGSAFERFAKVLRDGGELGADVSILKIFTTELYQRITEETIALAGEDARYFDDIEAGNDQVDAMILFLDSRAPAIFGGSNEIQRNILSKAVLGLPG